ncbi:CBL-interacting protein kinase [Striga asiatica]|uniref:CBL-interacting protein kinase n=1 Tax=Striga asiatica TaxID=4170 RepID=A0A5A7QBM2_STRAF|nr:CBL-interacting protein kinase [Striga asiatica]
MNTTGGSPFSSSSSVAAPTFDNLLLQYLISRLHFRPPNQHPLPPFAAANSLEDLLVSDLLLNLTDSDSDSENNLSSSKTQLAREESKLEKEIVRTILSGEVEKSKPNSGLRKRSGWVTGVGSGAGTSCCSMRRMGTHGDFGYFHDPLTIVAEIFELTSSLRVVEIMRKAGDMSEYVDFCNGELRSGLLRFLFVFYLQVLVVAGLCSFLH